MLKVLISDLIIIMTAKAPALFQVVLLSQNSAFVLSMPNKHEGYGLEQVGYNLA